MKAEIESLVLQLIENCIIDINTIPNIDLYVDQLTSFIEEHLYSTNENNLTKSMVNNYCKNQVIPPSIKKKYTKSHILLLIIVYNTKSIISISDIQKIFETFNEEDIIKYYTTISDLISESNNTFKTQIDNDINIISSNLDFDTEKEKIAILATKLAFEANAKKMLSELLIKNYL